MERSLRDTEARLIQDSVGADVRRLGSLLFLKSEPPHVGSYILGGISNQPSGWKAGSRKTACELAAVVKESWPL